MARVERLPAATLPRPTSGFNDVLPIPKNRKHKIVLESVTQEKKKLKQVITFNAKPPLGFTFIPAGNPQLTNALKEASRKSNAPIYTVTTTPHANVHDLSQQVHRIGYHFSSLVVADVCNDFGIQLSATGQVIGKDYETFRKGFRGGKAGVEEEGWDQITLNTKARDAIKDLFPNIPDKDLFQIIKTAFQKNKKRVGTATELPLARRAQLAVVAHIRHCYTAYDRLLRNGGYHDARGVVEKPTLAKLVEWRGDDENGTKVLEDVFREVVVISDEEDSDDDYDPETAVKELSVEVVAKDANFERYQTGPNDQRRISARQDDPFNISDDDIPGVRFVSQPTKRPNEQQKVDRRGFSRYKAWNEAREIFRTAPNHDILPNQSSIEEPGPVAAFAPRRYGEGLRGDQFQTYQRSNQMPPDNFVQHETIVSRTRSPPLTFRGADGAVYTRIMSPPRFAEPPLRTEIRQSPAPYDPSRPSIPDHLRPPPPPFPMHQPTQTRGLDPNVQDSDVALPSIESDTNGHGHLRPFDTDHYSEPRQPGRQTPPYRQPYSVVDLTNSNERPSNKRRRIEDTAETRQQYRNPALGINSRELIEYSEQPLRRLDGPTPQVDSSYREDFRGRELIDRDPHRAPIYQDSLSHSRAGAERYSDRIRLVSVSHNPSPSHYSDAPRTQSFPRPGREEGRGLQPSIPVGSYPAQLVSASSIRNAFTYPEGREAKSARYEPPVLQAYSGHPKAEKLQPGIQFSPDLKQLDGPTERRTYVPRLNEPDHGPLSDRVVYEPYEPADQTLREPMAHLTVEHQRPARPFYDEPRRLDAQPNNLRYAMPYEPGDVAQLTPQDRARIVFPPPPPPPFNVRDGNVRYSEEQKQVPVYTNGNGRCLGEREPAYR